MQNHDHEAFLIRMKSFKKDIEKEKKLKKSKIKQKMLDDLKKKHIFEKKQEIEYLKKRLEYLEKELKSYGE